MDTSTLSLNSILKGNDYVYHIDKVLGQGSFGITYLATTKAKIAGGLGNIEYEIKVAVKEFFMKEFNCRHEDGTITEMTDGTLAHSYLRKFRKEAENLAKLSHPNIVNVLEVFETNNTCYYAMEYISGGSLDSYVKTKGGLPEKEAIECIQQIGLAVAYMHDHKMLHLDLKPANVMRREDNHSMVLIDFGLSKQYDLNGDPESSTSIGLGTPGYAPIEQSNADREKDFAPTLDVYALGATFYKLLTGKTPPRASEVNDEGLPVDLLNQKGISRSVIHAIELVMEPRKSKRVKTVNEFLSLLSEDIGEEQTDFLTISLDKTMLSLTEGTYSKLLATTTSHIPVKWSSSNLNVASVDKNGYVKTISPGTASIIATCDGINAVCHVEVLPKPVVPKPSRKPYLPIAVGCIIAFLGIYFFVAKPSGTEIKDIILSSDTLILNEGSSEPINVTFTPSSVTDTIFWSSSDTLIATVDSNGCVTARNTGTVQITANSQFVEKSCFVQVISKQSSVPTQEQVPVELTSISLNKTSLTLKEGDSEGLKLKFNPSNAKHDTPVWKSSDPKIASVDVDGVVTAHSQGSTTIKVNCGTLERSCQITVSPSIVELSSISLDKNSVSLEVGNNLTLNISYNPSDATHGEPTWVALDSKIVSVSSDGTITAKSVGSTSITVSCNGKNASCNVTVKPKPTNEVINGHEYVDLGLPSRILWATCNIGATSPSDYGDYFAWGETSAKSNYNWESLKYRISGDFYSGAKFSKYVTSSTYGNVDNRTRLEMSDDAARVNWGGSWRMPTDLEWEELKKNCTWQWTSQEGHNGYKVTSKRNNNSIFLPAAGEYMGSKFFNAGEDGDYWSSSLNSAYSLNADFCAFNSSFVTLSSFSRSDGRSVRPVSSSIKK